MITSCRHDQTQHEGYLAEGLTMWMRGEDSVQAIAASRVVGETVLMWRTILNSKLQR